MRVPKEYTLKGHELRLVREALDEAISSVNSAMDSGLPPDRKMYDERDRRMQNKWSARLSCYRAVLKSLGGRVRSEDTSFEILCREAAE